MESNLLKRLAEINGHSNGNQPDGPSALRVGPDDCPPPSNAVGWASQPVQNNADGLGGPSYNENGLGGPSYLEQPPQKRDPRETLDERKRGIILCALHMGASRREAARQVGCCHRTIARTAARDPEFARQLVQAEAHLNERALSLMSRTFSQEKYWRAAAWVLERRDPEQFGKRDPKTFTRDAVTELFTRFLHAVLPQLPPEARETVLDEYEEIAGDLTEDLGSDAVTVDRKKFAVEEPPPVAAPPEPPRPEAQCPKDAEAAEAWLKEVSDDDLSAMDQRAGKRVMRRGATRDWKHWRALLRDETERRERLARAERKRRRLMREGDAPQPLPAEELMAAEGGLAQFLDVQRLVDRLSLRPAAEQR